ncbi:MAG: protein disulfide oxidoreductase [Candidatus Thiodiazotropha sp.]|jgi:peroxiredoxin
MSIEEKKHGRQANRLVSRFSSIFSLLLALFLIHLWQTRDLVEGTPPMLSGQTLQGEWFDMAKQTEWPVLIHFWASWCQVCRLESSGIQSLSRDYPVIAVAMQSGSESDVSQFLKQHQLEMPVINDPDGKLAAAWQVRGVPTSYIVSSDGRIRFSTVGFTFPLTLRMRLWLAEFW